MRRIVLISALFAISLSGCNREAKTPEAGNQASPGAKLKIVYIPKNTGNPYFSDVVKGFEDAAKEIDCDFVTTAPATADATSQIPIIKEQIQRHVDVIALTPNSPDALNGVLDEARKAGILVIAVDADLEKNESHRDAAVLPTDFSKIGASQIELLGSQIGYEGNFAILSATRDAPNQNAWIAGMQAALNDPKYAKMKLVTIVYGDDEPQKSTTEFEALMTKYPDLRGVISPTSVGLAASAQSLSTSERYPGGAKAQGPGLVLTGLSTPNQMKRYVDSNVVHSFQLWSPHDMGFLACELAAGMKKGTIKAAEGASFDLKTMGSHQFGKNNVVNTGPLTTFDKTNISKYDF